MILIIENDIISKEYPLLCETDKKGIENFYDFTAQKSIETFIPSITLENIRNIFFEPENSVNNINIEKCFVWANPGKKFTFSELINQGVLTFMDCLDKHKRDFFGLMDEFYFKQIKDRLKEGPAFIISKSTPEHWRGANHLPKVDVLYFDNLKSFIDEVCSKMEFLSENWLKQNNCHQLLETACDEHLIDFVDDYYMYVESELAKFSEFGISGDFEIDSISFNKLPDISDIDNLEMMSYKTDKLILSGEFTAELAIQFHMCKDGDDESEENYGELLTEESNHEIEFSDDRSATLHAKRTFNIFIEIIEKKIQSIWIDYSIFLGF